MSEYIGRGRDDERLNELLSDPERAARVAEIQGVGEMDAATSVTVGELRN
jgi:hypothetical protein